MKFNIKTKLLIWLIISMNLLFAFFIGFTLPNMNYEPKYTQAIILIPLLCIFNYILLNRFKDCLEKYEKIDINKDDIKAKYESKRIKLQLMGKTYKFSNLSLLFFLLFAPIFSCIIYLFLSLEMNYWLNEITAKQVVFILNLISDMNAQILIEEYPVIYVPNHPPRLEIITECTAAHIFSISIGIIISIPSSEDSLAKKEIIWRKTKTIIVSILCINILNIIRIVVGAYLNYKGIPIEFIHQPLFYISAVFGAIFFIYILNRWMPEMFISIYYIYRLIYQNLKAKSNRI